MGHISSQPKPEEIKLPEFEVKKNDSDIKEVSDENQINGLAEGEQDTADSSTENELEYFPNIETIKKNGLAKGGSLENAIVVKG